MSKPPVEPTTVTGWRGDIERARRRIELEEATIQMRQERIEEWEVHEAERYRDTQKALSAQGWKVCGDYDCPGDLFCGSVHCWGKGRAGMVPPA